MTSPSPSSPGAGSGPASENPVLEPAQLAELERFGRTIRLPAGRTLFEAGESGDSMYVVRTGEVAIEFSAERPPKLLGPGTFFGEISLVLGAHERSATARARSDAELLELDQGTIDRFLSSQPALLFSIVRKTCGYLLASERKLTEELARQNLELRVSLDFIRRTREELGQREIEAQTDPLTGLYNRRCLDAQLGRFVDRARREGEGLALLSIDLDGFKAANDRHGHAAGDRVLVEVGEILRRSIRRSDLPCRVGGDEFLVILFGVGPEAAARVADEVRAAIESTRFGDPAGGGRIPITASIGGTSFAAADEPTSLLERVDRNLYRAKREGRNRVAW